MTDKWSVKWLYIAVRKQSFLTHVQARYENKTLRRLMKASFQQTPSKIPSRFQIYLVKLIRAQGGCLGTKSR